MSWFWKIFGVIFFGKYVLTAFYAGFFFLELLILGYGPELNLQVFFFFHFFLLWIVQQFMFLFYFVKDSPNLACYSFSEFLKKFDS